MSLSEVVLTLPGKEKGNALTKAGWDSSCRDLKLSPLEADSEVRASEDEVAQHKERCGQLEARVLALEAGEAESAAQLQAAEEERRQLTERLASAEAMASDKVVELQQAHDETTKLEQRVAAAEAAAAESQDELRKVQSEKSACEEQCQQLESRLAKDPAGGNMELKTLLIENAKYEERCEQLKANLAKAEVELSTKTSQNQKLLVEAATYKERCSQLERQLAEDKGLRPAGIYAAYSTFERSPASGEAASSGCEPSMSETSDLLDVASVLSCSSWFLVKPHCFMMDAIFKTRSYGVDFFMMGKDLTMGSQVVAGDDETLLKVAKTPEVCQATEVVLLKAGAASLQVTQDHLVQVPQVDYGKEGESGLRYVPAGSLEEGDLVMLDSGEPMALTNVERKAVDCEVLKIVFEPDLPVAVFSCPPCILSKGYKKKPPVRRGGMCQRGKGMHSQTKGGTSIPVTAGEYMD